MFIRTNGKDCCEYKGLTWMSYGYYENPTTSYKWALMVFESTVIEPQLTNELYLEVYRSRGSSYDYYLPGKSPNQDCTIHLHEAFTEVERLAIFAETGLHIPPSVIEFSSDRGYSTILCGH